MPVAVHSPISRLNILVQEAGTMHRNGTRCPSEVAVASCAIVLILCRPISWSLWKSAASGAGHVCVTESTHNVRCCSGTGYEDHDVDAFLWACCASEEKGWRVVGHVVFSLSGR